MSATVTREGWESLFWRVFEQSRNAMMLLDGARVHRAVNEAAVELFGYSRDELIGMALDELYPTNARPVLVARWDRFIRRGEPYAGRRVIVCAGGTLVEVEAALHTEVVTGHLRTLCVILHHEDVDPHEPPPDAAVDVPLTPREREIVHLIALGLSGPEVADQLVISHDTVRTHVRNAMEKVDARTRAHLVAIALGQGALATD